MCGVKHSSLIRLPLCWLKKTNEKNLQISTFANEHAVLVAPKGWMELNSLFVSFSQQSGIKLDHRFCLDGNTSSFILFNPQNNF